MSQRRNRAPERSYRTGERGVVVRVVRTPHDALRTDERQQRRQRLLVDLVADPALPGEVLARRQLHIWAEAAERLCLLVEPFDPERRPAATGFQENQPQPGMALQHTECNEL